MARRKYFFFNKQSDYQRGYIDNFIYRDSALLLDQSDYNSKGIFISRMLDSQSEEMQWHRFEMIVSSFKGVQLKISIYASESIDRDEDQGDNRLDSLLINENISFDEKKAALQVYLQKEVVNQSDFLLNDVYGRYIWFIFETNYTSNKNFSIKDIKISFPRDSWLKYLPQIYKMRDEDQFLERYINIFQSFYEDLNLLIDQSPAMIDVNSASEEVLRWLALWIDYADSYMWTEEKLRALLNQGVSLFKRRGTKKGLSDFVEIFLGERAFIIEYKDLHNATNAVDLRLIDLLNLTPYDFAILVKDNYISTPQKYSVLTKVIDEMRPAKMNAKIVALKPGILLGECTLLEINSVLSDYRQINLEGLVELSFSTILK